MNRQDQVNAAYGAIVRDGKEDDFTTTGKVRVEAIQARLNLDPEVKAEERDAAMNAAEKAAPRAPDGRENTSGAPQNLVTTQSDAPDLLARRAEKVGVVVNPDWSREKLAEEVAAAEEKEAERQATEARLRLAAEKRAGKANAGPRVQCRITRRGDGKISTGDHIGGQGDLKYEKGDSASFPKATAEALELKGYVEIV